MICYASLENIVTLLVFLISVIDIFASSTCEELPVINNGELSLNGRNPPFSVNDFIPYTCHENFRTDDINPVVTCVVKDDVANWTEGACKPIVRSCHDPGILDHASRRGNLFTFPNSITYVCDEGYRMVGIATKYCSITGHWQPPNRPYCEAIVCPGLIPPQFGEVLHSQRTYGTIAVYKCDRYHKLVGDSKRKCQNDGTWSGDNPVCEKITCAAPGKFPNGRIIGKTDTVYNASDILIYKCNDGSSHGSIKCLESGEWSERLPICAGATVIEATTITNDLTESSEDDGIQSEGTSTVEPTSVTIVSSTFPEESSIKYEVNSCEDPGTIKNGDRTFMGLHINSTVTYTCDEGYYLRGKPTLLCLKNGKWNLDKLPICVRPLSAPEIIGIVFSIIILICIIIGSYLWYRYRMKNIRGYGEKSKALTADATDIDEIAGLEKDKKQIPVTVL